MEVKDKEIIYDKDDDLNLKVNPDKSTTTKNAKINKNERDYVIDIIRIIACIIVIANHCCLQAFNEYYSEVDWSRLFEKCFLTDAIPLFFMITGFFIVNGRNYKTIWKSTIKKVLLPTFVYILFAQVFYMYIINKESFKWCLKNSFYNFNIQGIVRTVLTGNLEYINSLCEHLWYIFSYIKIIIWVPIIWLLCKEEKNSILARRIIIGFGVISAIIIDIQKFITIPIIGNIRVYELVSREILYVLFGYELFIHKELIKNNKKVFLFSSIIFIFTNILRYKVEQHYMVINHFYNIIGRVNFIEWQYSILSMISGISLFSLLYSILTIKSEKTKKIILFISNKTFGIYLIHYLLLAKVDLYKFDKLGKLYQELIYLILSISITFISSLIIVALINKLKEIISKVLLKINLKSD